MFLLQLSIWTSLQCFIQPRLAGGGTALSAMAWRVRCFGARDRRRPLTSFSGPRQQSPKPVGCAVEVKRQAVEILKQ